MFHKLRGRGRALRNHYVDALHVGDIYTHDLSHGLMEENCADTVF
jgi:anaerobic ribonucleoside-triphosphate reductase